MHPPILPQDDTPPGDVPRVDELQRALDRAHRTALGTVALLVEGGLLAIAVTAGWLLGAPLKGLLSPPGGWGLAAVRGVLAAVPMLMGLALLMRVRLRPVTSLRRRVRRVVRQLLKDARWWELGLLAALAGIAEEVAFRGVLQPLAIGTLGAGVGIVAASLAFGLVHAADRVYFALATALGAYLGVLAYSTGEIVSAIVAHALYDLVAFVWLLRPRRPSGDRTPR